jgi:hypothetical protein
MALEHAPGENLHEAGVLCVTSVFQKRVGLFLERSSLMSLDRRKDKVWMGARRS